MLSELYVDDSSTADGSLLTLTGALATAEAWDAFYEPWDKALLGPPAVKYWSMSNSRARRLPFDALEPEEQRARELVLAPIVREYVLRGLTVWLRRSDWETHYRDRVNTSAYSHLKKKARRMLDESYRAPFHTLATGLLSITNRFVSEHQYLDKFNVVIELDETDPQKHSIDIHNVIAEVSPQYPTLGTVTLAKGKQPVTRPLEAADMIAWCRRRYGIEEESPEPIWDIIGGVPGFVVQIGPQILRGTADDINASYARFRKPPSA